MGITALPCLFQWLPCQNRCTVSCAGICLPHYMSLGWRGVDWNTLGVVVTVAAANAAPGRRAGKPVVVFGLRGGEHGGSGGYSNGDME